jgi:hypothetical protein
VSEWSGADGLARALREAVSKDFTARGIGKWLGYRKGRVLDGLRLDSVRNRDARGWELRSA